VPAAVATEENQVDLFAHASHRTRPAFPPDPAMVARRAKIAGLLDEIVALRARMVDGLERTRLRPGARPV